MTISIRHRTGIWTSLESIIDAMQETALTYQRTRNQDVLQLSYDLEEAFQDYIEALNNDFREEEKYNVNWQYLDIVV